MGDINGRGNAPPTNIAEIRLGRIRIVIASDSAWPILAGLVIVVAATVAVVLWVSD